MFAFFRPLLFLRFVGGHPLADGRPVGGRVPERVVLGARAFDGHASVALSLLALASFVVTLLLGILILTPRAQFVFSTAGSVLYRDLHDLDDPSEQHRHTAYWLDAFWEANKSPIQRLTRQFEVAAGALVVQILCWVLAVSVTLS